MKNQPMSFRKLKISLKKLGMVHDFCTEAHMVVVTCKAVKANAGLTETCCHQDDVCFMAFCSVRFSRMM